MQTQHQWNRGQHERYTIQNAFAGVSCLRIRNDRLFASSNGSIFEHNLQSGSLQRRLTDHTDVIRGIALDGDLLASGGADGVVNIWHTDDETPITRITSHGGEVLAVDINMQSGLVASGGSDCLTLIHDIHTGALLSTMNWHASFVTAIQMEGNLLVTGSRDGTAKLYDLRTSPSSRGIYTMSCTYREKSSPITCLQIDGQRLVTAHANGSINMHDLVEGNFTSTLRRHRDVITSLHFDDTRLITGCVSGCVGVTSWREIYAQPSFEARYDVRTEMPVMSVRMDDNRLYYGDKAVHIMDFGDSFQLENWNRYASPPLKCELVLPHEIQPSTHLSECEHGAKLEVSIF
eukprot:TRINITY_DN7219_c0_g1_i1.p1 TRINITY_DN7219_c0_g1~~TRINITY_DN7219_c0_g1_i1.p1  ORF type:complete len:347 (-),score=44.72 TRINITY_DN7219_c0_g1_i1:38-1078(-)